MFSQKITHGVSFFLILVQQFFRKVFKKKIITVIGDSHSLLFQNPLFKIKYIGPATAFKIGSKDSTIQSRKKIIKILDKLNSRSTVLFVFGEIDCRLHIYNVHMKKNIPINKVLLSTVDAYCDFIKDLKKKYPKMQFVVCGVFPQGEQGNIYKIKFYAKRDRRMEITKNFNKELEKGCRKNKVAFINVFDDLIDKRGKRLKKYVFDEIHFNNKIVPYIIWELKKEKIY